MSEKEKIISATYYLRLPVKITDEWEKVRKKKGFEKGFMATQAFRYYLDNVIYKQDRESATT